MNKIFLSHSSNDKKYVKPIYMYFGGDRCIYDEMTFEAGMKTITEIFRGLDDTDIFVLFISNAALNSEWVQKEIYHAQKLLGDDAYKLSQIFPIIIDDTVHYNDARIPDFLKKGFDSYNIRYIKNQKVACKKIENQLIKHQINKSMEYEKNINFFYGRDIEKKKFKDDLDQRDTYGKVKHIKCLVISGIDGIGRKAYARAALKDAGIIESYYFPMSTSLSQNDTIDDLIYNLSNDLGLGDYSFDEITTLGNIDSKIEILSDLLNTAQNHLELILIDDDSCLIKASEMVYWFEKALEKIDKKVVVIITTRIRLNYYKYMNNKNIFEITLNNLEPSDTYGFLREYSKLNSVPFEDEDIDFFTDILTGYPLQIQYCVNLAKENGIQYVKDNSYKICEMPTANSAKILDKIIEDSHLNEYKGFLSLLANIGTVPVSLINYVIKKNDVYSQIFNKIKMYTICNYIGTSGEFVKLNNVIRDYILRYDFKMTDEIKEIVNNNMEEFLKRVEEKEYMDYLSFSEFSYYLKETIKDNKSLPDKFLYSTVYVKSIIELYNSGGESNYNKVITLVEEMKKNSIFANSDEHVKGVIQFYLCSSLARLKKSDFDAEVSYFKDNSLYVQYNFLKGFNYRLSGLYQKAEKSYLNVLNKNPRHDKARRELVLIYTNMQDYDTALDLAEQNYADYPENLYQMQAYFDCLIHIKNRSEKQNKDINDIMNTIESIHRTNSNEIYYQLKAKYAAFIGNDTKNALNILEEGLLKTKNKFYLYKDYFDICKRCGNKYGMEKSYGELKNIVSAGNSNFEIALLCREAYLNAFQGKSKISIELKLKNRLTDEAANNILIHVQEIIKKQIN